MFYIFDFVICTIAAIAATLWVYWGVPLRVVANFALVIGLGCAILNLLLWLGVVQLFWSPPIFRVVGATGLGVGAVLGGLLAHVFYTFNIPAHPDGA